MQHYRLSIIAVLAEMLLMLSACSPALTPTPIPTQTSKPIEEIVEADCELDVAALVFYDANANGIFDENDVGMEHIRVHIETPRGRRHPLLAEAYYTDEAGLVEELEFMPGCGTLVMYPDVPPGYNLTTGGRIEGLYNLSRDRPIEFGLRGPSATVLPTPSGNVSLSPDQMPACTLHSELAPFEGLDLTPMLAEPDGSVWVANIVEDNNIGVAHYDPSRETWTAYNFYDGLPEGQIYRIKRAPDGAVWLAMQEGAARFDGTAWTAYDVFPELSPDYVMDLTFAPDGRTWFAGDDTIASYDPGTETYAYYSLDVIYLLTIQAAQDGSIWIGGYQGAFRLTFTSEDPNAPHWIGYQPSGIDTLPLENYEIVETPLNSVLDIAETDDGMIWLSSQQAVAINPITNEYSVLDPPINPDEGYKPMAVASDGSMWFTTLWGAYHVLVNPANLQQASEAFYPWDQMGLPFSRYAGWIAVVNDKIIWVGTEDGPAECIFP